jgi:hypothetical protein
MIVMETQSPQGTKPDLEHLRVVEEVLGVPLLPEQIMGIPVDDGSIRSFAYESVVRALDMRAGNRSGHGSKEGAAQVLREDGRFRRLAAEVQAANDTLVNWHIPPVMPVDADTLETARGRFQSRAMQAVVEHAQRSPSTVGPDDNPYRNGLLTMAPPGAGKTVLQALAVNYAGVGLPISESDPRRRTGVGILNSRLLIRQGLDEDETLQRFTKAGGRDLRIGAYFNDRRDGHDEYDLLLTTPRSYEKAVKSGAINPETTVRYVLDEAHRVALAPGMQKHMTEFDSGLYMFTATPAIAGGRRDLRRQFPHSQFGSLREFVEDGILSPVQLFTYRAGTEADSAGRLAVGLAADYVKSGRKTLVVCQPGEHIKQARDIAQQLNTMHERGAITPHERFGFDGNEIACAIGTYPGSTPAEDIARFRAGERLIATTVATGNEGMNIADLDALIIIGPQGATWVVEQWLGRILRPSGRLAVASEILPHDLREGRPLASIFGPFGLHDEVITAGYYIGPSLINDELPEPGVGNVRLTPPGRDRLVQTPSEFSEISGRPLGASELLEHDTSSGTDLAFADRYSPPAELEPSLVTGVSVREATIAPADMLKAPPPEYAPLTGIAPEGVELEWLYAMMDKLDDPAIRYIGVWEPDAMGEMQYLRYYSPAAHTYFDTHPIPELVGEQEFLDEEIARMLNVSRKFVRSVLDSNGIKPLNRITKYHRSPNYYGLDTYALVAAEVAKIPFAEESDVAVTDLGRDISVDFIRGYINRGEVVATHKRRHPMWGVVGTAQHISSQDADMLVASYKSLEVADFSQFVGFTEIARIAGVAISSVLNKWNALPEAERPPTRWLRSAPKVRPAQFVDRAWGEAFAEVLKPEKVLPWEATLSMIALYFGKQKLNMGNIIKRRDTPEPVNIPLPGVSETKVYPMSVILDLRHEGMPPAPDAPPIIAPLVALAPEDAADAAKVVASQDIQKYYISKEQLVRPDEIDYYVGRRASPPRLPLPFAEKQSEPEAAEPLPEPDPFHTLASVRQQFGCTPHAFKILMQRAELPEDEIVTDGNTVIGVRDGGFAALDSLAGRIAIAPSGWTSLPMVSHAAARSTKDAVMAALARIEHRRGYAAREDEVLLCRNNSEVELYFSVPMKRAIRHEVIDG